MKNHVRFVECQGEGGLENWAAPSLWSHHWQQERHRACLLSSRRVGSRELHLVLKWPFRREQGWEVQRDTGPHLAVRGWLINRTTFKNNRWAERSAMSPRECGGDSQGRKSREPDQELGHFNRPRCQLKEVSGRGEKSNARCRSEERCRVPGGHELPSSVRVLTCRISEFCAHSVVPNSLWPFGL